MRRDAGSHIDIYMSLDQRRGVARQLSRGIESRVTHERDEGGVGRRERVASSESTRERERKYIMPRATATRHATPEPGRVCAALMTDPESQSVRSDVRHGALKK